MTLDLNNLSRLALEGDLAAVQAILLHLEEVTKERDEADRRAGAAERRLVSYVDERAARQRWLEKAKFQWGAESHVSFDTVWAEALALKAEKDRGFDMTINIAELRESIAAFGSQAINEDDLNELLTRLESEEEANREWGKKTYWVQEEVQKGELPLNYLGWHRADILRAEVLALRAQVAGLRSRLEEVGKERDALRAKIEQMGQQKPVGTLHDDGCFVWRETAPHQSNYAGWKMTLYALPGAQSVPNFADALRPVITWLRNGCDPAKAADELELIVAKPAPSVPDRKD